MCVCCVCTVLPNSNSANEKKLQEDNVSLAYEFAKKVSVYLTSFKLMSVCLIKVTLLTNLCVSCAQFPGVSTMSIELGPLAPSQPTLNPNHVVCVFDA
jgi:hypothetical protein